MKINKDNKKDSVAIQSREGVWYRFYEPFVCLCCGKEISKRQFCFSTLCGFCDVGKCFKFKTTKSWSKTYDEEHNQNLFRKVGVPDIELSTADAL